MVENFPVKFVSSLNTDKIGGDESHCLVTDELKKEDGHKDRFSPISERTNSFTEIKTDF